MYAWQRQVYQTKSLNITKKKRRFNLPSVTTNDDDFEQDACLLLAVVRVTTI